MSRCGNIQLIGLGYPLSKTLDKRNQTPLGETMKKPTELLDKKLGKGGNHTVINGEISESLFLLAAAKRSWSVGIPLGRVKAHDFLVKIPGESWKAVQVKTVYVDTQGNGKRISVVSVRKGLGKNYVEGDFDYLFAASEHLCWMIPWSEMKHKKSIISLENKAWDKFILS